MVMRHGFVMAIEPRAPRLAVLIDAENISPKIVTRLFREIEPVGEAIVRRIYGDFSGTNLRPWIDKAPDHGLTLRHVCPSVSGKNATDIAMVIEAIDLMHGKTIDGFCLVTSDSDFTGLALRIRESGARVHGFGETKTSKAFRGACSSFTDISQWIAAQKPPSTAKPVAEPIKKVAAHPKRQPPSGAAKIIANTVATMKQTDDGWVGLSALGKALLDRKPPFSAKASGYKKLSDLLNETGSFVVEGKTGNKRVRIESGARSDLLA